MAEGNWEENVVDFSSEIWRNKSVVIYFLSYKESLICINPGESRLRHFNPPLSNSCVETQLSTFTYSLQYIIEFSSTCESYHISFTCISPARTSCLTQ